MAGPRIFLITGSKGGGKSSFASALAKILDGRNCKTGGFIAPGSVEGGIRSGFSLAHPDGSIIMHLATRTTSSRTGTGPADGSINIPPTEGTTSSRTGTGPADGSINTLPTDGNASSSTGNQVTAGSFAFNPEAIRKGHTIIRKAVTEKCDVIFLDEVGAAEMEGKIWAEALSSLLDSHTGITVLVTSRKNLTSVIKHWDLAPAGIFDIDHVTPVKAAEAVISNLKPTGGYGKG
ncbi:MAG: hypothetical protein EA408_07920 [Marinilabiliales bacterium]|nr:MAG: hypothetical protein EA408_07920 [Marinilabiliales bacterium]